ncbi:hypothetical protein [Bacteriovorax sp. DB6_IX]|uniref:hypothetical protein n=1 Tax=Bacteriovorax sp. DB6_IX TaxID=1353530 RepID=UPI00038A11B0|nr:hypothetical protein [Bacteriovorax sp. DB6_IX]EQC50771.1 hypothetical protein M901_2056 [Bacteriovorax sp. DB6_IX]
MKSLKFLLILQISYGLLAQDYAAPTAKDVENGNITDQEKIIMENYEHGGYLQRNYEEELKKECDAQGLNDARCRSMARGGNATSGKKFMGLSPAMMKAVGKAYAMVVGMTDIGSKIVTNPNGEWNISKLKGDEEKKDANQSNSNSQENSANGDDAKPKTTQESNTNSTDDTNSKTADDSGDKADENSEEEMEDYCRLIAVGVETVGPFFNQKEEEFIMNSPTRTETAQVTALHKQARAHGSRAKGLKLQITGWGATTACYTAMMAGPASATSWQNYLKLGASALMWRYYEWEKGVHKDAQDTLNRVASKLKGSGDCNPVSDRDCYCAQPETQNDVKYCMPQIRDRMGQSNDYQVSCINDQLKEDPACQCVATDTCLDKTIRNNLESMHIPQTASNKLNPFFQLTRGTIKPGSDDLNVDTSSNKVFATAKDLLRDNADKVSLPINTLSDDEKKLANELEAMGIPKTAAIGLSGMKLGDGGKKVADSFSKRSGKTYKLYSGGKYKPRSKSNSLYFSGGKGINKTKKTEKTNQFANIMNKLKRNNKKGANASDANVLRFAERASKSAQITKDKSEDIFKIISRRYQVTARKRLEVK